MEWSFLTQTISPPPWTQIMYPLNPTTYSCNQCQNDSDCWIVGLACHNGVCLIKAAWTEQTNECVNNNDCYGNGNYALSVNEIVLSYIGNASGAPVKVNNLPWSWILSCGPAYWPNWLWNFCSPQGWVDFWWISWICSCWNSVEEPTANEQCDWWANCNACQCETWYTPDPNGNGCIENEQPPACEWGQTIPFDRWTNIQYSSPSNACNEFIEICDINQDGICNRQDLVSIQRHILQLEINPLCNTPHATLPNAFYCDANNDGYTRASDLVIIRKYVLGRFCGCPNAIDPSVCEQWATQPCTTNEWCAWTQTCSNSTFTFDECQWPAMVCGTCGWTTTTCCDGTTQCANSCPVDTNGSNPWCEDIILPTLSITPDQESFIEGETIVYTVTLSESSDETIYFDIELLEYPSTQYQRYVTLGSIPAWNLPDIPPLVNNSYTNSYEILPWQTTLTISFPSNNDIIYEWWSSSQESIVLRLNKTSENYLLQWWWETTESYTSLSDNETKPTLTLQWAETTEGQTLTFLLNADRPSEAAITNIIIKTANGTATVWSDYNANTNTTTLQAYKTQTPFTITTIDDTSDEQNETLTARIDTIVQFFNPYGQQWVVANYNASQTALWTIIDNDNTTNPTFSCQWELPNNTTACNNNQPLQTTNYAHVSSCSNTPCTYTCSDWYARNWTSCIDEIPAESYSRTTTNRSACSETCGNWTQTRTVSCVDSSDKTVADSFCAWPKPTSTQSCNLWVCPTYSWHSWTFWTCSEVCWGGTQSRWVECRDQNGLMVAENLCSSKLKPTTTQACNTQACTCTGNPPANSQQCLSEVPLTNTPYAHTNTCTSVPCTFTCKQWFKRNWSICRAIEYARNTSSRSTCSELCGEWIQTRTVTCTDDLWNIAADQLCRWIKPATSQPCNEKPCQTYSWFTWAYDTCSKECGWWTQSRIVECRDQNELTVAETFCASNSKPTPNQSCNTQACACTGTLPENTQMCTIETPNSSTPYSFVTPCSDAPCTYSCKQWFMWNWKYCQAQNTTGTVYNRIMWSRSVCSVSCGNGIQTRTVQCSDTAWNIVADSLCKTPKPSFSQPCTWTACATTYSWFTWPFTTCSKPCWWWIQTRIVECRNQNWAVVSDAFCPLLTKPIAVIACNTQTCTEHTVSPVKIYIWFTWTFGVCDKSCGWWTQTRPVECRDELWIKVADTLCSSSPKPTTQQSCNAQPCATTTTTDTIETYKRKEWERWKCTKACWWWEQTRSVVCTDSKWKTVEDDLCPWKKPETKQKCNTQACIINGACDIEFGLCSAWTLWNGNFYSCGDPSTWTCFGQWVWATSASCSIENDPCDNDSLLNYRRKATQVWWCSELCEWWIQQREVICVDDTWKKVEDRFCTHLPKPPLETQCNQQRCTQFTRKTNEWSTCSESCGWWWQTRLVTCVNERGNTVAENLCAETPKPTTKQACNTHPCPEDVDPTLSCGPKYKYTFELSELKAIKLSNTNDFCLNLPNTDVKISEITKEWVIKRTCPYTYDTITMMTPCEAYIKVATCWYADQQQYQYFFNGSERYPTAFCAEEWAIVTDYKKTETGRTRWCKYPWLKTTTCEAYRQDLICEEKIMCECTLAYTPPWTPPTPPIWVPLSPSSTD